MLRCSSMKWMCNNLLKLNQDKTELVVKILNVRVGVEFIAPKSSACNPVVIIIGNSRQCWLLRIDQYFTKNSHSLGAPVDISDQSVVELISLMAE